MRWFAGDDRGSLGCCDLLTQRRRAPRDALTPPDVPVARVAAGIGRGVGAAAGLVTAAPWEPAGRGPQPGPLDRPPGVMGRTTK
jgi:hypothetical protein